MTVSADALATELADMRRRLEALERSAQMSRTSIEGGALVVNDDAGSPVLTVGRQSDGAYAVAASNGAQVVANVVDLPAGSITETDIAEGAISTPKLAANAITADKIAVDALDARTIRGNTIIGAQITGSTVTAGTGGEVVLEEAGLFITNPDDNAQYIALSYTDPEMGVGITLGPGKDQSGAFPNSWPGSAAIHATGYGDYTNDPDGRYAPTLRIAAPYNSSYPSPPTGIDYSLMLLRSGDEEGGDPRISLVTNIVEVSDRLTTVGDVAIGGALAVGGVPVFRNVKTINNAQGTGTTTVATYAALPGTSSLAFTKKYSGTQTKLIARLTASCAATAVSTVRMAVRISGTDYDIAHRSFETVNKHDRLSGEREITGVSAGTYTVQAMWRRVSGTGTISSDSNDWLSLAIEEVPV
ncbi:hypothetical protein Acy02nite_68520 [Actinoplanes cyaneus]|uniref:Uncharacterized protein n=1 Tax=Actinoplanes cyaneus TaxID=52696 RepID=A0A919IPT5_9ACTN|nr:hypothetical protein [Actinoplanes cyaneus]MCW2139099.1 hypothetical protein [Actinoplanes cyaneus]GID68971.1 hypothetical protein Acy02nite_68520 [Actinoplanes cyaneus]